MHPVGPQTESEPAYDLNEFPIVTSQRSNEG